MYMLVTYTFWNKAEKMTVIIIQSILYNSDHSLEAGVCVSP